MDKDNRRMGTMASKMVTLAVAVASFSTSDIASETYTTHPDLSADAASAIALAESTEECELSEAVAVEIEGLLTRQYDALTVQTEAAKVLQIYSRCMSRSRSSRFLAQRLARAEEPSFRVYLLYGLAKTRHPIAVDAIVERIGDSAVSVTMEGSDGSSTNSTVGATAVHILREMFPDAPADSANSWKQWWRGNAEDYRKSYVERPSD
jgi:hypothetical protein